MRQSPLRVVWMASCHPGGTPPHQARPHGLYLSFCTMNVMFWRNERISSGTSWSFGHAANAVVPSRSSATVAAYGFGGR